MEINFKNLQSLNQFIDEKFGQKGITKRDELEPGYEAFKLGILIQQARGNNRLSKQ